MTLGLQKINSTKLFNIASASEDLDVVDSCLEILDARVDTEESSFVEHARHWVRSGLLSPEHALSDWAADKYGWKISDLWVQFEDNKAPYRIYRPDEIVSDEKTPGEIAIESLLCQPYEQKQWANLLNEKDLVFTPDEVAQIKALAAVEAFEKDNVMWIYLEPYVNNVETTSNVELEVFDLQKVGEKVQENLATEIEENQAEEKQGSKILQEKMEGLKAAVESITSQRSSIVQSAREKAEQATSEVEAMMDQFATSLKKQPSGPSEAQPSTPQNDTPDGLSTDWETPVSSESLIARRLKKPALSVSEASQQLDQLFGKLK